MENPYESPKASQEGGQLLNDNNSGMKENTFPEGVKGFSWGGISSELGLGYFQ